MLFRAVLLAFLAVRALGVEPAPPELPPQERPPAGPWELTLPDPNKYEVGLWPFDQLYQIVVENAGRKRVEGWIDKGLVSISKNIYRRYVIEQGYFLILLPPPDSNANDDHLIFVPKDPDQDPRVIFMKDIHRLSRNINGMHQGIVQSLLSGDENLLKLAGRTAFDSKYTVKEWSHTLSQKDIPGVGSGRHPYYYRFRQNGLTRVRLEAGVGQAWQLGDAPYYVGAALGAEAGARVRLRTGFTSDAVPRAKLGVWGKVPFVTGTSFGLSAIQGWHASGGSFDTEFRAGLYSGSGQGSFGLVGWHRLSAANIRYEDDSKGSGAQASYSPDGVFAFFVNYDRASAGGKTDETWLAGVEVLARRKSDPAAWARQAAGPGADEEDVAALLELARAGYIALDRGADASATLDALREKALESAGALALRLPDGPLVVSAGDLLEAARAVEKWRFLRASRDAQVLPGWAPREVNARSPEEALAALARGRRVPPQLLPILLVHAAGLRRGADFRAAQAALFLTACARSAHDDPYADVHPGEELAVNAWRRLAGFGRTRLAKVVKELTSVGNRLREDLALEAGRLEDGLRAYGVERLAEARSQPSWPAGLEVTVAGDAWGPVLGDYGERTFADVLSLFEDFAADAPVSVTIGATPLRGGASARRLGPGRYYVDFRVPPPEREAGELRAGVLKAVAAALAAEP